MQLIFFFEIYICVCVHVQIWINLYANVMWMQMHREHMEMSLLFWNKCRIEINRAFNEISN